MSKQHPNDITNEELTAMIQRQFQEVNNKLDGVDNRLGASTVSSLKLLANGKK